MTEYDDTPASPVVKVARDLREIERLHSELIDQAIDDANSRLMPGGLAMVQRGPVANLEAWENLTQASEVYARAYTSAEDEDPDDAWPAFQTLTFWSETWRREHGDEYDMTRTIATEASYIRARLGWAWDHEIGWDAFAADMRRARLKLEDVVHDGRRHETTRVECPDCDPGRRLIRLYGEATDGSEDRWKCTGCKTRYDADGVSRAHAKMLRSEGAAKWVQQTDAIGTLRAQGRSERTVRQWLSDGEGEAFCDPVTHQVWVWWPDLWRRHLATPTRNRASA